MEWALIAAVAAILGGMVRMVVETMQRGAQIDTKGSSVRRKGRYCIEETNRALQRIDETEERIAQIRRDIEALAQEVKVAEGKATALEAKAGRRNPTRHKVTI